MKRTRKPGRNPKHQDPSPKEVPNSKIQINTGRSEKEKDERGDGMQSPGGQPGRKEMLTTDAHGFARMKRMQEVTRLQRYDVTTELKGRGLRVETRIAGISLESS